ncbi:hypothetical protein Pcinc_018198 [Petrolisthes cinctipes]|uniref:hypoxia-inducible factor-proline dioxygenase n=1 Tax=Petrolisthes cinctipes TaxID=88211 RepID=A0AAE1FMM9_PETCI|nr:hypothetical protein Pcinc_018198 [Petrolisthes cinctipes]
MSNGVNFRVCAHCHSRDGELRMCSRCKNAWYCNKDHQMQHWQQHKQVCKSRNGAIHKGGSSVGGGGGGGGRGAEGKKAKWPSHKTNFSFDDGLLDSLTTKTGERPQQQQPCTSQENLQFQGSGGGRHGGGRYRRRSPPEPDLSTPIDSSISSLEASLPSSQSHRSSKTSALFDVRDGADSQTLEEGGFNEEWFAGILESIVRDLNQYGVCVIDDFLGAERADHILNEVKALESHGALEAGQVVSRQVQDQARGMIRGDQIAWVTGGEPHCSCIGQLVTVVDSLVAKANKHQDAGMLANYNITWRTRAMVACYPGRDTHYVKHVDNPNGDGRCITAIYYLNRDWSEDDGGVLRIYPEGKDQVASIEPLFDRMLFFWSDRRNPHEVLPAKITRYAITVWYLDQKERNEYLARLAHHQMTTTQPTHA